MRHSLLPKQTPLRRKKPSRLSQRANLAPRANPAYRAGQNQRPWQMHLRPPAQTTKPLNKEKAGAYAPGFFF
jgi:hypothetical protein